MLVIAPDPTISIDLLCSRAQFNARNAFLEERSLTESTLCTVIACSGYENAFLALQFIIIMLLIKLASKFKLPVCLT
jgi:hypothetical protein